MDFRLHYPTTIAEAVAARRSTGGSYLCGGTVLLVDHYNGKRIAQDLVSLERIEELHRIDENDETISIGSACSFSQIEKHPAVKRYLGALYLSAREIGGPQIRNRGSIGGNYASASPASDMIAPILVLDPEIVMEDDLIVRFVFRKDEKVRSAFRKVGKRTALAVSSVSIAVSNRDGVYRVAVGSCAPKVVLCSRTSEVLSRGEGIERAKDTLMGEISPIDDRWGSAEYRRAVVRNLLERLVEEVSR